MNKHVKWIGTGAVVALGTYFVVRALSKENTSVTRASDFGEYGREATGDITIMPEYRAKINGETSVSELRRHPETQKALARLREQPSGPLRIITDLYDPNDPNMWGAC